MHALNLSQALASEVQLLGKMLGRELPDWTIFFRIKGQRPDFRGLVVKKFGDCGFGYSSLAQTIGCDRKSLYVWEGAFPANDWLPEWDAYFRDRRSLLSIPAATEYDFRTALDQLGRELLIAMRRDPTRFFNECGALLNRLNNPSFAQGGDKIVTTSFEGNHPPSGILPFSQLGEGNQHNGR